MWIEPHSDGGYETACFVFFHFFCVRRGTNGGAGGRLLWSVVIRSRVGLPGSFSEYSHR